MFLSYSSLKVFLLEKILLFRSDKYVYLVRVSNTPLSPCSKPLLRKIGEGYVCKVLEIMKGEKILVFAGNMNVTKIPSGRK